MEITDVDKLDIFNHFDKKVQEVVKHERRWKQWAVTSIIVISLALISSGYINAKAIGGLQTKTEILWTKYVPGDLLWVIMYSYDLQNEYTLSLLNGDREGAEEKFEEFVKFRKDMYEKYFQTRGATTPTEGRVMKSVK